MVRKTDDLPKTNFLPAINDKREEDRKTLYGVYLKIKNTERPPNTTKLKGNVRFNLSSKGMWS